MNRSALHTALRCIMPPMVLLMPMLLVAWRALPAPMAEDAARTQSADRNALSAIDAVRFGRDIRPLLSDRCFTCHGPDPAKRQANLRLDQRDDAIAARDGGAAIVPGDPGASEIVRRITSSDPAVRMPPPDSNKRPLTPAEQAQVQRWIRDGAAYEPHWAFSPPQRPLPPDVRIESWRSNPIDRFLLATMERAQVAPSPPADRSTLLRRVFLDLTGLPPTLEEQDAFLADKQPDAYERWVDKLLTEEPYRARYAERMAAPWLDAARYADTSGIHMDAGRQMWLYRDWVLSAFRNNLPFDQFVTQQLAGDLLPDATPDQKTASGFNRCHVTSDEGGAIADEYLVEYAVDRTATTGSVFLGLTVGCARCHEHKYDPISQEEFYKLYSFFNSIEEPGLYSQLPDANRALEPFLLVPSAEQRRSLDELDATIAAAKKDAETPLPIEAEQRDAFLRDAPQQAGVRWHALSLVSATSTGGATLTPQPDGSILASGENPPTDSHVITLRTAGKDLRLLTLEALPDASFFESRVGRAVNGNAVLTGVEIEASSTSDPTQHVSAQPTWIWADIEQADGDYRAVNALNPKDALGWAVDAHRRPGGRTALLLTDKPFGFDGGTELRITLQYNSIYPQHTFGRVRISAGSISDAGLARLPAATSGWYTVGPFPLDPTKPPYETVFEPQNDVAIDLTRNFGFGNQMWKFAANYSDAQPIALPEGRNITFVGRRFFSPTARSVAVSLGSDDGFALYLDGKQVAQREVERGVKPDQDQTTLELQAGTNVLIYKIVNTGGQAGYYFSAAPRDDELTGDLVAALLPDQARSSETIERLKLAWRLAFSPGYRAQKKRLAELEQQLAALRSSIPLTMVMQELPQPRATFVLTRGQYDKPDKSRPVTRAIPKALGSLPDGAPLNRLGLAQWLVAPENPLVARVAVNRMWELFFGAGLVRTTEDFGLQGEWPSHPELLDWLAVEYRECGWNTQHMIRLIVTSEAYRQSSRVRTELRERDPENRWLTHYPRRRLSAEQIRDQALYVSGLLVERVGGPSAKPYQPDGIWQEVSMPQSNTRDYKRGAGDDLWRRSLYTYWKRASPPPSMMMFDAPTRESCTIRRPSTNTPLQALVLWNDEQFVEAARTLATRTRAECSDDRERLTHIFRRCTGRAPDADELERLGAALTGFRTSFGGNSEGAAKLVSVGASAAATDADAAEQAAWTMIASAIMSLAATVTQG